MLSLLLTTDMKNYKNVNDYNISVVEQPVTMFFIQNFL
jgi:hypothetical protein